MMNRSQPVILPQNLKFNQSLATSRRSLQDLDESYGDGRQDVKEEARPRSICAQYLDRAARRIDVFIDNWYEEGLRVLAVASIGIVLIFFFMYCLLHTFKYMKEQFNREGSVEAKLA